MIGIPREDVPFILRSIANHRREIPMSASTHNDAACQKCSFFDGASSADLGLCRFNPPVSQPTADAHGLWPQVSNADWCGHYEPEPPH